MIPFDNTKLARVDDREYYEFMLSILERAKSRVWASIFIYDIRPGRDLEGLVMSLTTALINCRGRGVDVKVLLAGFLRTGDIAVANLASGLYLSQFRVPNRRAMIQNDGRNGSHAKYVICDDLAVVGSQNWTDDGFRLNIEDAVVLEGRAVHAMEMEFLRQWDLGKGLPNN